MPGVHLRFSSERSLGGNKWRPVCLKRAMSHDGMGERMAGRITRAKGQRWRQTGCVEGRERRGHLEPSSGQ